jgi:hypothetical protein
MGRGEYILKSQYEYVGRGAGEFTPQMVTTGGYTQIFCCCGIGLLLLLLLPVLWFFLSSSSTTTPPGPPPLGPRGKCLLWGDPHVKVFDQRALADALPVTFLENGDYWLVKSRNVWIQGRYEATEWTNGKASLHGIAIGGPFLHGNKIIVGPKSGKVYYNNQQILVNLPSTFSQPNLFHAEYHDRGVRLDSNMKEELWFVKLSLPGGMTIVVNRWAKHIDAEITMNQLPHQDGHCGNFNGILEDDTKDQILIRVPGQVARPHNLFPPTHFNEERPTPYHIQDCKPETFRKAQRLCREDDRQVDKALIEACVLDVCMNGYRYAAEDAATELNARRLGQEKAQ